MPSYGQDDNLKGIYSAINKTIYAAAARGAGCCDARVCCCALNHNNAQRIYRYIYIYIYMQLHRRGSTRRLYNNNNNIHYIMACTYVWMHICMYI